ncbi:MAG: GNAT family N-acetyltransferase [Acidobacteriota bacterium]
MPLSIKDTSALQAAMVANMLTHMSYFQSRHTEMAVDQNSDLIIIDSRLACDTFNFICRARLSLETAVSRIQEAVGYFQQVGHPFSWWVSPGDEPATLPALLNAAGLSRAEPEPGMAMELSKLPPNISTNGLRIERALSSQQIADYATVLAALWQPPDINVITFYQRVSELALAADCPMRFYVGYIDDQPVATSELCLAAEVAGLYNIATLPAYRCKGYGRALTLQPLFDALEVGTKIATLQASQAGYSLYTRIGFESIGLFSEFQPYPK